MLGVLTADKSWVLFLSVAMASKTNHLVLNVSHILHVSLHTVTDETNQLILKRYARQPRRFFAAEFMVHFPCFKADLCWSSL
jgi:hypothetical protein